MKLTHTQRLRVAHEIRRQLPWAHIVVGAPRYNFIEVSRGEVIRGYYSTGNRYGYRGLSWTRPTRCAYALRVNFGEEWAEQCRHAMGPNETETNRLGRTIRWDLHVGNESQDMDLRLAVIASWIVEKALWVLPEPDKSPSFLRKHERFEVAVNELEPLTTRKAVRK